MASESNNGRGDGSFNSQKRSKDPLPAGEPMGMGMRMHVHVSMYGTKKLQDSRKLVATIITPLSIIHNYIAIKARTTKYTFSTCYSYI